MVHGPQAPPLRWLDPLAASDPGIPPAPPDPAGHVGDVLLVSCPGAGLRAGGQTRRAPETRRPSPGQPSAHGRRGARGGGMGRVVMAPRASLSHSAVDACLAHLLSQYPPSLTHFYPLKKPL